MADPQAVTSPIIMKVDSPVDDKEKEENENNERNELDINPNQVCSPKSSPAPARFGMPNAFVVKTNNFLANSKFGNKSLVLRPSQLGQGGKSFSLNPSKLNPFAKTSNDDSPVNKTASNSSNGDAPKFVPLLVSEKSNDLVKPATIISSHNFVFGQNLQERIAEAGSTAAAGEEPKPSTSVSSNGSSDMLFSSAIKDTAAVTTDTMTPNKSLSECAREYQELRANKRKYEEVETRTGEEDDINVLHLSSCKLFAFDNAVRNWQERGRGTLRLNDMQVRQEDGDTISLSRVVFRTSGVLRVIVNTKIWSEMKIEQPSSKSIRFSALDGATGEIRLYLIMAGPEEIKQLFRCMEDRLLAEQKRQNLKRINNNSSNSGTNDSESTLATADDK